MLSPPHATVPDAVRARTELRHSRPRDAISPPRHGARCRPVAHLAEATVTAWCGRKRMATGPCVQSRVRDVQAAHAVANAGRRGRTDTDARSLPRDVGRGPRCGATGDRWVGRLPRHTHAHLVGAHLPPRGYRLLWTAGDGTGAGRLPARHIVCTIAGGEAVCEITCLSSAADHRAQVQARYGGRRTRSAGAVRTVATRDAGPFT
jgi:hypothetical protein